MDYIRKLILIIGLFLFLLTIGFAEKDFFHSHNVDNQNNKLITFIV